MNVMHPEAAGSNDYPHPNIGNLPKNIQTKLIRDNAIRLYGLASRLEEN